MNKQDLIKQYAKEEDKILIAKLLDKIQLASRRNQIQTTDFLDGYQQKVASKILQQTGTKTATFFGGYEEAERKFILLFPEKLISLIEEPTQFQKVIQQEIKVIQINLPNELRGVYHHRDYLSAFMKLGIKRETIGDILVRENGADILVKENILSYLLLNLPELTRFRKAEISEKSVMELQIVSVKTEEIFILVNQLRLDLIVSEVLHLSRTKANEIIAQERVMVNYELKVKNATMLQEGDLFTIRGKGKFKLKEVVNTTSKGKLRVIVEKYIS